MLPSSECQGETPGGVFRRVWRSNGDYGMVWRDIAGVWPVYEGPSASAFMRHWALPRCLVITFPHPLAYARRIEQTLALHYNLVRAVSLRNPPGFPCGPKQLI